MFQRTWIFIACVAAICMSSPIVQAAKYEGGAGALTKCREQECCSSKAEATVQLEAGGSVKGWFKDWVTILDPSGCREMTNPFITKFSGSWDDGQITITGGGDGWNCRGGGLYNSVSIGELGVNCSDSFRMTQRFSLKNIPRTDPGDDGVRITVDVQDFEGDPIPDLGFRWGARWTTGPFGMTDTCKTDENGRFTFLLPEGTEQYQVYTWQYLNNYNAFSRLFDITETHVVITMIPKSYGSYSTVLATRGLVEYMAPGSDTWITIQPGKDILPGGKLRTMEESRAYLLIADKGLVRMAPMTELLIEERDTGKKTLIDLIKGLLCIVDESGHKLELKTSAALAGVKGTAFRYESGDDGDSVELVEGQLEITPTGGGASTLLDAGEKAEVKNGRVTVAAMSWDEEAAVVENMEDLLRTASTQWEEPETTRWGVYNALCCPDGETITFKITLDGATKTSFGSDCSGEGTWTDYTETTAGMLQVYEWSVTGCGLNESGKRAYNFKQADTCYFLGLSIFDGSPGFDLFVWDDCENPSTLFSTVSR